MKTKQKKEPPINLDLENDALEIAKLYAGAKGISFDLAVNELILRGASGRIKVSELPEFDALDKAGIPDLERPPADPNQAQRRRIFERARRLVESEGLQVPAHVLAQGERYIAGELTIEDALGILKSNRRE